MLRPCSGSDDSSASSTLDSSVAASTFDLGPLEETTARGSGDSPCRSVYPVTHPRDGHGPHEEALSSGELSQSGEGWMRWGPGCEYVILTHYSFLSDGYICRQGVLSSRGVHSPSRPATVLTNCTDVFTMMWMTTSACMSTAAVARTWILRRDGYGRSLSCVGGAARFLRGHRRVCLIVRCRCNPAAVL